MKNEFIGAFMIVFENICTVVCLPLVAIQAYGLKVEV